MQNYFSNKTIETTKSKFFGEYLISEHLLIDNDETFTIRSPFYVTCVLFLL